MKWAWIENGYIRDVCQGGDPKECYHPDIAKLYDTQVPNEAFNGDQWINGQWIKREPPLPPPPTPRQWYEDTFRRGMNLAEKTKWDNNSAPEIVTVKAELPKEQAGAQELVDFLVASNVISQTTATKIME